ncbi:MAG: hypothetical protein KDD50_02970, partial [Bdellovibrionales bacterium]|nr:hypothetical protein [Bdellovibrionales bacterium]
NETNYQSELVNVQKFKANLDGHPFFVVPKAFPEISTPSVLALEFMDGVSLNDWIASNPCEQDKIIVAHQLLDLFFKELFDWKIVQTDPNLANYLVQTNPLKIVLLDFGSCLSYTSDFVENYRSFVALSQSQDKAKTLQAAVDFELLDSRETEEALDAFVQMLHISSLPFLSSNQPFNFSSLDYERQSRQSILNFVKKLKYTPPPRKILFMHRRLGGLFNTLKKMKIAIDLGPYWEKLQKGG